MGTEIYLVDDASREVLDTHRAYWLAEAIDAAAEDPIYLGGWEFIEHEPIPTATVLGIVRSFEGCAGDRPTKEQPSRELVARLLAWLSVRDVVRLATDYTFRETDPGWTVTRALR